jgi:hypothetical protein
VNSEPFVPTATAHPAVPRAPGDAGLSTFLFTDIEGKLWRVRDSRT